MVPDIKGVCNGSRSANPFVFETITLTGFEVRNGSFVHPVRITNTVYVRSDGSRKGSISSVSHPTNNSRATCSRLPCFDFDSSAHRITNTLGFGCTGITSSSWSTNTSSGARLTKYYYFSGIYFTGETVIVAFRKNHLFNGGVLRSFL